MDTMDTMEYGIFINGIIEEHENTINYKMLLQGWDIDKKKNATKNKM